ncbi:tyrosine-type recombinase/integrase [Clostridium perfringens]|uniref:tyrosine-type recombinase/integrase n=1 Tax=Clostridium perfringens TaxID=1502 RepID=UPI003753F7D1
MAKKRNRNLKSQLWYGISKCFKEGVDKRAVKEEIGKNMTYSIYSYDEVFRLKDTARALQKFLVENGYKINDFKKVDEEQIQKFLNNAKENGCTQNSINTYANSLFKIEKVLNRTYGFNLSWRSNISIPAAEKAKSDVRGANSVIKREDYNKLIDYAEKNISQSGYALRIQDFLGVRVEEVARISKRNIDLENKTIKLTNTKGGKELTRYIPENKIGLIKEVLEHNYHKDRLFSIKGSSINKYLRVVEEKLEIEKHSNHDIRRLIAQEKYDSYRESGLNVKDAANKTSKWLSHGDDRQDMLEKSYIKLN